MTKLLVFMTETEGVYCAVWTEPQLFAAESENTAPEI
jgi:hypothetical protein